MKDKHLHDLRKSFKFFNLILICWAHIYAINDSAHLIFNYFALIFNRLKLETYVFINFLLGKKYFFNILYLRNCICWISALAVIAINHNVVFRLFP